MAETNQASEPTMEEILASIRRIISDDENAEGTDATDGADANAVEPPADDVTEPVPDEEKAEDDAAGEQPAEDAALDEGEAEDSSEEADADTATDTDTGADEDDVFDLTNVVEDAPEEGAADPMDAVTSADIDDMTAEEPAAGDEEDEEDDDIEFAEIDEDMSEPEPAADPEPVAEPAPVEQPAPVAAADPLVSEPAQNNSMAAFDFLASTLMSQNGASRTLEDLVQDMLRPFLKEWLDEHLPGVVERLVQDEIERIARGRR